MFDTVYAFFKIQFSVDLNGIDLKGLLNLKVIVDHSLSTNMSDGIEEQEPENKNLVEVRNDLRSSLLFSDKNAVTEFR